MTEPDVGRELLEEVADRLEMCAHQLEEIGAKHMLPHVPGALAIQCAVKAKSARQMLDRINVVLGEGE